MIKVFTFIVFGWMIIHLTHAEELTKDEYIQKVIQEQKDKNEFISKIKLSKAFDSSDLNQDKVLDDYEISLSPEIKTNL